MKSADYKTSKNIWQQLCFNSSFGVKTVAMVLKQQQANKTPRAYNRSHLAYRYDYNSYNYTDNYNDYWH